MGKNVLVVLTYRPIETLLREGGSQAWALNAANARRCSYLVCCRNRHHEGAGPEEHGAAFLVGKISGIEAAPEASERYIVRFSEYAVPTPQPAAWSGSRNPVWYVDNLSELGIDETALDWHPMPTPDEVAPNDPEAASGSLDNVLRLTIADAKVQLAATFGVSPDNIEIIVRG